MGRYFNSRPSARGDLISQSKNLMEELFQFTPLREGRPTASSALEKIGTISIHAPPRGATNSGTVVEGLKRDFNSRPSARGDVF